MDLSGTPRASIVEEREVKKVFPTQSHEIRALLPLY